MVVAGALAEAEVVTRSAKFQRADWRSGLAFGLITQRSEVRISPASAALCSRSCHGQEGAQHDRLHPGRGALSPHWAPRHSRCLGSNAARERRWLCIAARGIGSGRGRAESEAPPRHRRGSSDVDFSSGVCAGRRGTAAAPPRELPTWIFRAGPIPRGRFRFRAAAAASDSARQQAARRKKGAAARRALWRPQPAAAPALSSPTRARNRPLIALKGRIPGQTSDCQSYPPLGRKQVLAEVTGV